MKKVILMVAIVFTTTSVLNASSSLKKETSKIEKSIELNDHYQCKRNAISIAYTAADILGTEPSVAYFKEVYMECMGY